VSTAPGDGSPPGPPASEGRGAGRGTGRARRPGVWELAWPSMTLFALYALVGVVDFVFVSSLGTQAVAGVGAALQIHFLAFALLSAVTTGTVAVVAREFGAGDQGAAAEATCASVALSSLLALAMMAAIPFTTDLVGLLGVAPAVAGLGGTCLATLLLFNVPFAVEVTLTTALRGAGDVRTPLLVGIAANVFNVILDYALIFGAWGAPELGAPGSALATGLSFALAALLVTALWARDTLLLPFRGFRRAFDTRLARRLLRVGLPTAVEQVAFNGGLLLFLTIVAEYGTEPVSAYLIGVRILSFCFVPGFGFATAAATLVGQHLGADEPDLALRAGWRAMRGALAVMGCVGLAIVIAAEPLAGWFGAAGASTVALAVTFIYILGAAQPLMAIEFSLGGALRGAGDTRFPLVAILTGLFGFRLGGALLVAQPLFGTVQAVCCLLLDYAVKAVLLSMRFARGRWQRVVV